MGKKEYAGTRESRRRGEESKTLPEGVSATQRLCVNSSFLAQLIEIVSLAVIASVQCVRFGRGQLNRCGVLLFH